MNEYGMLSKTGKYTEKALRNLRKPSESNKKEEAGVI